GRRVLVVGDMRELGEASAELHRRSAEGIARSAVDLVIAVGENAKLMAGTIREASAGRIATHAYASTLSARRRITALLKPEDTVLVKGSRAMGLEKLVEAMRTAGARKKPAAKRKAVLQ